MIIGMGIKILEKRVLSFVLDNDREKSLIVQKDLICIRYTFFPGIRMPESGEYSVDPTGINPHDQVIFVFKMIIECPP